MQTRGGWRRSGIVLVGTAAGLLELWICSFLTLVLLEESERGYGTGGYPK
jgi:hypothetical protein